MTAGEHLQRQLENALVALRGGDELEAHRIASLAVEAYELTAATREGAAWSQRRWDSRPGEVR